MQLQYDETMDSAPKPAAAIKSVKPCLRHIADRTLAEVRGYFQIRLPDSLAKELAERADWTLTRHPHYPKLVKGPQTSAWIKTFMRHWLASPMQKAHPAWYRNLPASAKRACHLPATPRRKSSPPAVKVPTKRLAQ